MPCGIKTNNRLTKITPNAARYLDLTLFVIVRFHQILNNAQYIKRYPHFPIFLFGNGNVIIKRNFVLNCKMTIIKVNLNSILQIQFMDLNKILTTKKFSLPRLFSNYELLYVRLKFGIMKAHLTPVSL